MERLLRKLHDAAFMNSELRGLPDFAEEHMNLLISLDADLNSKLHCGSNGCIINAHDPNWVIKITKDPDEVKLFSVIANEKIRSGFVRIKDIIVFPESWSLIVKQRVTPLNSFTGDDADEITADYVNFMHVYYQEIHDVMVKRKSLPSAISKIRKHTFGNVVDIFSSLRKLAYAGYRLLDIDLDNVGFSDGDQLVIFDAQLDLI